MNLKFKINQDSQSTDFVYIYQKNPELFELIKENVFLKTWHWIGDENLVKEKNSLHPFYQ